MLNFKLPITLASDSYKYSHWAMLPENTQRVYSYFESRNGSKFDGTLFYGLQTILKEYFTAPVTKDIVDYTEDIIKFHLGIPFNRKGWDCIVEKHNGLLPIEIKAVPEGLYIPTGNILMSVVNKDEDNLPWLTNFVETVLTHVWYPSTVATLSYNIAKVLYSYLKKSCEEGIDLDGILRFMLHDFGCRGVENMSAAALGGSAHLLNFYGTDTVPSLLVPKLYYNEGEDFTAGFSIPASEHSIMTARGPEGEMDIVRHLLKTYPKGVLSIVIDSYDYKKFLEAMVDPSGDIRKMIENRDGRVVFRPDSGNPVEVAEECLRILSKLNYTVNSKGFKVLPSCVRLIWGDGIDLEGIKLILDKTLELGWSAENWVFGMGGGLLQKVNRDTCRFAFKCSAQQYDNQWYDVQKNPLDKSKASKPGRLELVQNSNGEYITRKIGSGKDNLSDILQTVYENGCLKNETTFSEIRHRIHIN